ncbi:glycosyltransferase [Nostocoides sp. Soil756]|jgi:GT2 family glycosyltransferase|uniref:glycosyltransferase n=1 Tax=Nostocoides sp. Soil756 TaxID=1736399 RepID=UPI0006F3C797|nr:glycosyltransferase [Tetrasphaera sp. Soil756]KRE62287.1 hypothetical protein ASG78_04360 [Tetrasphaera sp. Soil756]
MTVRVSVVVVGYGEEPALVECLEALVQDVGDDGDVVLVDNGILNPPVVPGVRVLPARSNLGFAGGCSLGVASTVGEVIVFVNSDAVIRPGAVRALVEALCDPSVGLVSGCVLVRGEDDAVNSTGNPVHVSGLSWAGGLGEPRSDHLAARTITSISGALFATRRDTWEALGGMRAEFFLYYEDTDLSLRCWLAGWRVAYCPDAVALHSYEFDRNPRKMYLLERNRLASVLTVYPPHLLRRALPVVIAFEPLLLLIAVRDGWAAEKLRAWGWLALHARKLRRERRAYAERTVATHALDDLLVTSLPSQQVRRPPGARLLDRVVTGYWRRRSDRAGSPKRGRPDVVVLRTNPRDSSLPRLLTVLTSAIKVQALVWDRTGDYECPVKSDSLQVQPNVTPGRYHHASTLLSVLRLQPWFLSATLRARPRAVHAMDLDTGVVGLLAARLLRVPFVYQCLDPYAGALPVGWPRTLGRFVNVVENMVISKADLFVITDLLRMPQHAGATPRSLVELANVPMSVPEPQPFSESGLVVGYIGSLVPHRSLETIIDTVGSLAAEGVSLVLGGFGPLEEALQARAERYPNVSFLGWVDDRDLMATLGGFDVFVQIEDPDHPAYRWVSPNKVFESMALGRPIVVAMGTLAADRIAESGHGVTVSYGVADDLRTALLHLLHEPAQRASLGEAGRRAFTEQWSPDIVSERVLGAYVIEGSTTRVELNPAGVKG